MWKYTVSRKGESVALVSSALDNLDHVMNEIGVCNLCIKTNFGLQLSKWKDYLEVVLLGRTIGANKV